MGFLRKANKKNFTVIDSDIIRDDNLSLKDLGLLIRLLSLPDNWEFSENGLMIIFKKDKQGSIRTGLKNLENLGYLERSKVRDSKGKYVGCDWIINEQPYLKNCNMDNDNKPYLENPNLDNSNLENPYLENPNLGKPSLENQPQYNINKHNIKEDIINQQNTNQLNNQSIYQSKNELKEHFEYDKLIYNYPIDMDMIDEMIDIIYEVLCSNKTTIRVNGEEKLSKIVKARFNKLDSQHIQYVITSLSSTASDIKNIRNYIITTLYNAPTTMDNYYKQKVNYDLTK